MPDAIPNVSPEQDDAVAKGAQLTPAQRRTMRLIRLGVLAGVLFPILLLAGVAAYQYGVVRAEAEERAGRVARIASEHAIKVFDTNQILLERLLDMVQGQSDAAIAANEKALHDKITALVGHLPQVQSVWVLDAAAHPLLTNRFYPAPRALDLSDRDSFRAHKSGEDKLFITGALLGKKTRDVFFDLTRRRAAPDGTFLGTVQVSLYPKYFVDFYRQIAAHEPGFVVSMTRSDGTYIARWPEMTEVGARISTQSPLVEAMGAGRTDGLLYMTSTVDRTNRVVAFRQVDGYPVYVAVGIPRTAILATWGRQIGLLALFTIPLALALAALGVLAIRRTEHQFRTANALHAESLQRQQVERALFQAQKMEALGHLTGGVAHDFNNLLMVIDMNANLLQQSFSGLRAHPRLEAILRAVENGAKLTRQLLSFSRRQPLMLTAVRLGDELQAMLELCRPVLGSNVTVNVSIEDDFPAVRVDRAEFELALLNLAVNAKHAMPNGGTFEVKAGRVSGDRVRISVRDTGDGIPASVLPHVLEPFFTTRPKGYGTGLGLSQVSAMCARAGGEVRIESAVGVGTVAHIELPVTHTEAGPHEQAPPSLAALPASVLLVEDNAEIGNATELALISLGCAVHRCNSADEAIRFLHSGGQVEAVLSDVAMPGDLDGIALAQYVRNELPGLGIALMTGYAERLAEAEALGVIVLAKPFGLPALRDVLSRLAGHGHVATPAAVPLTGPLA